MKYNHEERMDIGRRMYAQEIDFHEAMETYGISASTAHKYMTDYKRANNIPLSRQVAGNPSVKPTSSAKISPSVKSKRLSNPDIETYMAMSKEELIDELILAKANELRAKKGYEVKGVGANKEFISLNRPNLKS